MTLTPLRVASPNWNKEAEDPNLWNDQSRAQRVMRERDALDDQLKAIRRIEQEFEDQLTLIELGETEKDEKTIVEAEGGSQAVESRSGSPRVGSTAFWRGRRK
mgnify:CR=1 FL=1